MTSVIQNMNNWQKTMRTLSESAIFLFNNETMSDVTFVFNNHNSALNSVQIHAHSWILSMLSPVFYESFKENFEVLKQIPMSEASYDSFLQCIRFVYTSECILTQNNAFEVMKIARKYSLTFLEEDCADYIIKSVSVESVCPSLDNAITFGQNTLKDKLIEFIAPNIASVLKTKSFPKINKESLEAILSIEKTGPINEMEIFNGAIKWASQKCISTGLIVDGFNKREHLGELVKKIRFPTMTSSELGQCIAKEKGLLTDEEGYSLLLSASTDIVNKFGFRHDQRNFFIDLDRINVKEISLFSSLHTSYRSIISRNFKSKSRFTVHKMIYITGISIATPEIPQYATIQFFNDKNKILLEETFEVVLYGFGYCQLTNPILINPNQEYIVDVKFQNIYCNFRYAVKQEVPCSKTKEGNEFCFSRLSQLLKVFYFKSVD